MLGPLIEKFLTHEINLSPKPSLDSDGRQRLPALDNHAMGTVFEELIRRFNEENNEEAGEHFTPRDVVTLMADLVLTPVADQIKDGTYTLYDGGVRYGRNADRRGGPAEGGGSGARQDGVGPPLRAGESTPRRTRSRRPICC